MGIKNYLIEGVCGTGKTTVAEELQRRGYHVLHGDRELAYWGDRKTGEPVDEPAHESEADRVAWQQEHWLWNIDKVKSVIADHSNAISFFCGGSRNFFCLIDLLDRIFVLDVEPDILKQRLASRPENEFGGRPVERDLIYDCTQRKNIPKGDVVIDATAPLEHVVDAILKNANWVTDTRHCRNDWNSGSEASSPHVRRLKNVAHWHLSDMPGRSADVR